MADSKLRSNTHGSNPATTASPPKSKRANRKRGRSNADQTVNKWSKTDTANKNEDDDNDASPAPRPGKKAKRKEKKKHKGKGYGQGLEVRTLVFRAFCELTVLFPCP